MCQIQVVLLIGRFFDVLCGGFDFAFLGCMNIVIAKVYKMVCMGIHDAKSRRADNGQKTATTGCAT